MEVSSAREYFESRVPQILQSKGEVVAAINAVYEFQITGDGGGVWTLNLKTNPPSIQEGSAQEPDCTVIMENDYFVQMIRGELKAQLAFLSGKLKVTGNMGLALKLTALFT